jgi:hypothetical protein
LKIAFGWKIVFGLKILLESEELVAMLEQRLQQSTIDM